ncbi:UDP-glycosyltransferase 74F2 [Linum perenne]
MTNQQQQQQPHCLVIPIPSTGHINPMLQFSKRLIHKGIKVTLVLTRFLSNSITSTATTSGINLAAISDGYDDGGMDATPNPGVYLTTFREVAYHGGLIKPPVKEEDGVLRFDGLPTLTVGDRPSFVSSFGSYPAVFDMLVGQFDNMGDADWVLCNSVYELEHEAADWLSKKVPNFTTIGPTIPSMYLDRQLQDDVDYGFNMFKPINEPIKNWLATKPNNSVVYVSFGSLATLHPPQMEELYHGLNNSDHYFLWVVRKTEEDKLPQQNLPPKKGVIVSWCPQLKVLASPAVGCFMTHCGWNSTLESLSLGVPMVAMPQWTDQSTNAKFIRDVWKVGVKVKSGDDGLVTREEVERCVKEVMEGDKGEEMRRNGEKFRVLMKDAASEGGSSDGNILRFVGSLIRPGL